MTENKSILWTRKNLLPDKLETGGTVRYVQITDRHMDVTGIRLYMKG